MDQHGLGGGLGGLSETQKNETQVSSHLEGLLFGSV